MDFKGLNFSQLAKRKIEAKRLNQNLKRFLRGFTAMMSKLFKAITVLVTLVLAGGANYKI